MPPEASGQTDAGKRNEANAAAKNAAMPPAPTAAPVHRSRKPRPGMERASPSQPKARNGPDDKAISMPWSIDDNPRNRPVVGAGFIGPWAIV
ncbi:hypothetical protein [Paenibacillus sp.]|uniref:hypothetical protein n=1 Tax=Paenibacillus sp. TaxID=58172 RepID=UPI002D676164|nr:hypothetical protein [Paenibacillus sp.]HZG86546.1 hypothetical protein [Paenibacillus sp.]